MHIHNGGTTSSSSMLYTPARETRRNSSTITALGARPTRWTVVRELLHTKKRSHRHVVEQRHRAVETPSLETKEMHTPHNSV